MAAGSGSGMALASNSPARVNASIISACFKYFIIPLQFNGPIVAQKGKYCKFQFIALSCELRVKS